MNENDAKTDHRLAGNSESTVSPVKADIQLQMVWPEHLLNTPPVPHILPDYELRLYRNGDEPEFYRLMELGGWSGWNSEQLQPWLTKIAADSWFMIVHKPSNVIVATAMGLHHDPSDLHPRGGALGWVAADPDHKGKGLGKAVCSAVTARLMELGYRDICLYTDHGRLPALSIYFKMGYVPFLYTSEMSEHWQAICEKLKLPFTPKVWEHELHREFRKRSP